VLAVAKSEHMFSYWWDTYSKSGVRMCVRYWYGSVVSRQRNGPNKHSTAHKPV